MALAEPMRLLNTTEAAKAIGLSASWLNKSRLTGEGPPFISIGARCLYAVDDLNAWLSSRRHVSPPATSNPAPETPR